MYFNFTRRGKIEMWAGWIVFLGSVLSVSLGVAAAPHAEGVPVPEDARLADTRTLRFGKLDVEAKLYFSAQPLDQVAGFYRAFFAKEGFVPLIDKLDKPKRLLRYKRNDEVVSIALRPKASQTQIVVSRYLQPFGAPPPEKSPMLWRDLLQTLATQDQAGTDLAIIPRPPQSIRQGGGKAFNITILFYSTPVFSSEIVEFYTRTMKDIGWNLAQNIDMEQTNQDFTSMFPKKFNAFQTSLPFPDVTFGQLLSGGRMLIFTGKWGVAEITIMKSLGKEGTLVLIKYTEKNEKK